MNEIPHYRSCGRRSKSSSRVPSVSRVYNIFFGYLKDFAEAREFINFGSAIGRDRFVAVRTGGCLLNSEINISSSFAATRARTKISGVFLVRTWKRVDEPPPIDRPIGAACPLVRLLRGTHVNLTNVSASSFRIETRFCIRYTHARASFSSRREAIKSQLSETEQV